MTKHLSTVPRHEPEVIKAKADQIYGGNAEKVSTTSLNDATLLGVKISSRYGKAHEIETMMAMIRALQPAHVEMVKSIFCDSKATDCYSVTLRFWNREAAMQIAAGLDAAVQGHNGIGVEFGPERFYLDPDWRDGEDD
jgi:hypothetical protein